MASATTRREQRILSTLGSVAADVAATTPEAPVLFVIGRVVALYDEIVLADALACEGAGMAAYA